MFKLYFLFFELFIAGIELNDLVSEVVALFLKIEVRNMACLVLFL